MEFIRKFIEQKISLATGADVRIGKFSFSPLSGTVEVRDLLVGTFLAVRKNRGEDRGRPSAETGNRRAVAGDRGPALTVRRGLDGK